jgi:polyhydroxybutyrate depolymerase
MKGTKYLIFIPALIISSKIFAQAIEYDKHTIKIDGHERIYFLHLPENLPENAPLIFAFHGYGGSAKGIIEFSKMNPVADKYGFAVCYPQAVLGDDNKNSWNAGYSNPDVDDVNFLSTLAKHLQKEFSLSSSNTFCTGMSNGADMCYVLACQSPDVFSAVAPVAGCMMESTYLACNPSKPIPVFEIHGTDDNITLWNGDADYSEVYGGYKGIRETFDFWIKKNNCSISEKDILPDGNTADKSFIVREKYSGGVDNNEVWLYTIVGGKHDWPGSWGNMDIVAAEEIWNFFERFIKNK